ncbi:GNAT family N-acetyltransferase [Mycobacteroides abscessus]|uniref:GNAT family N-acetyltransferase n=1 Tax=Mycobacteroides abscessus TaxID=36809 RepID=UPI000241C764|nr:GNAT family N-acetyltransferase [Mycobacteroides abscessus]EHM22975.1 putative acetyltransferase [Mycobacteroides abscessus subsp. bolletii BD]ORA27518.1 N-acetyltransferase [Mycobacteroides abscessus subsp. bolletii]TPF66389.1 acetyltransferase [Mycobacteroides abscessus subsp. bolletii]BBB39815.1 putative acetyltransferase [Mycobacteroides abscessus subsp. bolletii BD]
MPNFSPIITDFWHTYLRRGTILRDAVDFQLAVSHELHEDTELMMLQTVAGRTSAIVTPELADRAGFDGFPPVSDTELRTRLDEAGLRLHGADNLFYFTAEARATLLAELPTGDIRQLTADDGAIFKAFESAATAQDLDDAQVELDHWAVFGSFDNGRLVAVSSIYQWEDAAIMDLGVLTLPIFRGRGHARGLVRAAFRYACTQGYEPQYRCQVTNTASSALAPVAGLTLFGTLDVIAS